MILSWNVYSGPCLTGVVLAVDWFEANREASRLFGKALAGERMVYPRITA